MDEFINKLIIIVGVIGLLCIAFGLITTLLGFGYIGISSGSIAAGIQSQIGNVVAGSLFAKLTSLGMTGTLHMITRLGITLELIPCSKFIYQNFDRIRNWFQQIPIRFLNFWNTMINNFREAWRNSFNGVRLIYRNFIRIIRRFFGSGR